MKTTLMAAALAVLAPAAFAAPQTYTLDPTHSQGMFTYDHAGFSTTMWMISGFEGEIVIDRDDLSASSVTASVSTADLFTGDPGRTGHIMQSGEFFKLDEHPTASFTSTSVEVTGDNTALITGDFTLNGVTKSIVLDTVLNAEVDEYPFPPNAGKPAVGFTATGKILRSDYGLGMFAPFVADEVMMILSVEALDLS